MVGTPELGPPIMPAGGHGSARAVFFPDYVALEFTVDPGIELSDVTQQVSCAGGEANKHCWSAIHQGFGKFTASAVGSPNVPGVWWTGCTPAQG